MSPSFVLFWFNIQPYFDSLIVEEFSFVDFLMMLQLFLHFFEQIRIDYSLASGWIRNFFELADLSNLLIALLLNFVNIISKLLQSSLKLSLFFFFHLFFFVLDLGHFPFQNIDQLLEYFLNVNICTFFFYYEFICTMHCFSSFLINSISFMCYFYSFRNCVICSWLKPSLPLQSLIYLTAPVGFLARFLRILSLGSVCCL